MMPIRFALSAIALCVALPAFAGVTTTTTYAFGTTTATSATNPSVVTGGSGASAFNNMTTTQTGTTNFQSTNVGQYGDGGTNYGNTITWKGSTAGSSVNVSAWSTTGTGGVFEKAFVGNYGGDLGVTSQSTAGNVELNSSHMPDTTTNQHALDNVGAYDALLFSFASATTLSNVSIGFPTTGSGIDSDSTILYWNGTKTGAPTTNLALRTLADLTANGWSVATNIADLQTGASGNSTGIATSTTSQYWLIGAYAGLGGTNKGGVVGNTGNDYFKVNGLTAVTVSAVPEPGSIALFGIAGAALLVGRRRRVRKG